MALSIKSQPNQIVLASLTLGLGEWLPPQSWLCRNPCAEYKSDGPGTHKVGSAWAGLSQVDPVLPR